MNDDHPKASEITNALHQAAGGNRAALDALLPVVYDELRRVAGAYMGNERADHTFQATALVHEAYVRLIGQRNLDYEDRNQFFAAASNIIRRILVDHARTRGRTKRGGAGRERVGLEVAEAVAGRDEVDMVGLNDALEHLAGRSERAAKVVELRFFGGLTMEEIAGVLGVSVGTVNNDWAMAKAWLARELARGDEGDDSSAVRPA